MENMWMKNAFLRTAGRTAENLVISHSFLHARLTGSHREDCYTFEDFASDPDEIHTAYYYHYKRSILGLKEETTWS